MKRSTFLDQKIYAKFGGSRESAEAGMLNLPELCLEFLFEQKESWYDLRAGYESLKDTKERDLDCNGFSVRLQFNPGRMRSSTADVADEKITERPCFLCLHNLPKEQKGILYQSQLLILCNPMPVFSPHFTLSHLEHRRQSISEYIEAFLQLAHVFGPGWVILYNGPKCGASAPDHLHFQAIPSGQLPIEKEWRKDKRSALKKKMDGVLIYQGKDLGRAVIILEGSDPRAVSNVFRRFLTGLKRVLLLNEEPMVNMIGIQNKKNWRLVVFPRQKHRPQIYYNEGLARVVVSPGSIDMGGLLITPIEKDFERLDSFAVESIYREVSLDEKTVAKAIQAME